jgi:hypothetical protein
MNCFNIRELQGILKRKFFTDLVNNHEHRTLMDKTMIGLRYKSNANVNLDNDMLTFYNFGITSKANNGSSFLTSLTSEMISNRPLMGSSNLYFFSLFNGMSFGSGSVTDVTKVLTATFSDLIGLLLSLNPFSITHFFKFTVLSQSFLNNFNFMNFNFNEA